jgi:hypothetical protein
LREFKWLHAPIDRARSHPYTAPQRLIPGKTCPRLDWGPVSNSDKIMRLVTSA